MDQIDQTKIESTEVHHWAAGPDSNLKIHDFIDGEGFDEVFKMIDGVDYSLDEILLWVIDTLSVIRNDLFMISYI